MSVESCPAARVALAISALLASVPLQAQSAQGDVAITIYNDYQALVRDVRQLTLPAGRTTIELPDVSAQIRAETVTLAAPDIGIVEQNFDFDLLSPAALMENAVGQTVTIVRTNPATGAETREAAKVLAANNGVVLQIGDRVEILRGDGLPVRVIFDRVPPNLRARPTLSVTVESARAGTRPVALSYLSPALGWTADYVALFDDKAGRIDVQGWITLTNNSGTTYQNAKTLLVAGSIGNATGPYGQPNRGRIERAGIETAPRAQLGDFYLYPLAERTTIGNAQRKQVSFLDVSGVPASRGYEYRVGWLQTREQPESADTVLRFSSARSGGLGDALPAGIVRVYMRDAAGQPQFIGENGIGHTPMGSTLALKTGDAFDVKVRPVLEARERVGSNRWRTTMRYQLTNARAEPVMVDLVQNGIDFGFADTRVSAQSQAGERRSASEYAWRVPVPANGESVVTATFETRF